MPPVALDFVALHADITAELVAAMDERAKTQEALAAAQNAYDAANVRCSALANTRDGLRILPEVKASIDAVAEVVKL